MNKRVLTLLVLAMVVVILAIILMDFLGDRPDTKGENPYKYDIKQYETVDTSLIQYREVRNIPIRGLKPEGIAVYGEEIWITGDSTVLGIDSQGKQLFRETIADVGTCITAKEELVAVATRNQVFLFSRDGSVSGNWTETGDRVLFTSIALTPDHLFVADAGNRRVLRYALNGELEATFEGKTESAAGHGFIVPSANFDLLVNAFDELWVVNPGKHALEHYSDDGKLKGYWQKATMNIDGFSGCCNPGEIAVFENGDFVTSEKGLVRIKVYKASGELKAVVAAPDQFEEEGKAPEVAVDESGKIYALDFDRKMIRIFEHK